MNKYKKQLKTKVYPIMRKSQFAEINNLSKISISQNYHKVQVKNVGQQEN